MKASLRERTQGHSLLDAASADEIAAQRRLLLATSPLSPAELAAFPSPQRRELPAGTAFLRAGERAHQVATVYSGGLREYFVLADGSERTKGFNLPGGFAGSLSDLLSGAPSRAWIVAEVPTVLLVNQWQDYAALVETYPGWQRFARVIAENLYLRKVQREYELLALDAAQRYRLALEHWPQLEAVFKQKHIASYVGISPVHLSRLRAAAGQSRSGHTA